MQAMIQNDAEKEWMLPLLQLRDELDVHDDRHLRDFRRLKGSVQLFHDRPIPGPYKQAVREQWLQKVLEAQCYIRDNGPQEVSDIQLITLEELEEIRRLWEVEKHEIEDNLPRTYEEAVGEPYPAGRVDDSAIFGHEEIELLREICGDDELHFQLTRELLSTEKRFGSMLRRSGIFEALESAFRRGFYDNEEDAIEYARYRRDALDDARDSADERIDDISTGQGVVESTADDASKGQAA